MLSCLCLTQIATSLALTLPSSLLAIPPSATSAATADLQTTSNSTTNTSLTAPNRHEIWFSIPGTPLTLLFDFFGDAIFPAEFNKAFTNAHLDIADAFGQHPFAPIPDNRFEYDGSDVHIAVMGNAGIDITWVLLADVLRGLQEFVTGTRGEGPHYRALHYEIYVHTQVIIGFGYLWYYPPFAAIT